MRMFNVSIIVFILGCILAIGGLAIYFMQDNTEGSMALRIAESIKVKEKERDDRITEVFQKLGVQANALEAMTKNVEEKLRDFDARLNNQDKRLEVFQDQCSDTREKQIQLRDDLSKKRPVMHLKGALPVEIYMNNTPADTKRKSGLGRGVKSLIKEQSK